MGAAAPFPDKPLPLSNWLFSNGTATSPPGREITYYNGQLVPARFEAQLLPGPPAQVRVRIIDDYPFNGGPIARTVTVPLQENTTCPDNS
jgi:hypothetical protein